MVPRSGPGPAEARTAALAELTAEIIGCEACPRLVVYRREVALTKRAAFADQDYWGRPVPGFGDPLARVVLVGLAPAAHGGNRTGRVFTGDRSGDWLFSALWRGGLANQPTSVALGDGLRLHGAYVLAAVRCVPPANRPTPEERRRCAPFMAREIELLTETRVLVALGAFAYQAVASEFGLRPRPPFGHGVEARLPDGRHVLCSYHPSQQNTFTGTLTEAMLDAVVTRAKELAGL
ncbi:MAG TPA: uracil-DNA glycosylase [Acidimicrobiales bacterium]|nr:uracil-DNA glycosylase [Acidimicrobiales bacterium]